MNYAVETLRASGLRDSDHGQVEAGRAAPGPGDTAVERGCKLVAGLLAGLASSILFGPHRRLCFRVMTLTLLVRGMHSTANLKPQGETEAAPAAGLRLGRRNRVELKAAGLLLQGQSRVHGKRFRGVD